MTIKYDDLVHLLGGEIPTGIQCVFTGEDPQGGIEMCDADEASYVSVYLRVECGEVRPVADYVITGGHMESAKVKATETIEEIRVLLGELPLEEHGALHGN